MTSEIKRSNWSRFFKKFNQTNQLRHTTIRMKHRNGNEVEINQNSPFIGIAINKKGRLIDGIEVFTGQHDPDRLSEPVVSIKQPVRIVLEKDKDGADNHLLVEGKDGTVASVFLSGKNTPEQYQAFVEKLAYSMYERRGFTPGSDIDDWIEAEKKIKEVEIQFVQ